MREALALHQERSAAGSGANELANMVLSARVATSSPTKTSSSSATAGYAFMVDDSELFRRPRLPQCLSHLSYIVRSFSVVPIITTTATTKRKPTTTTSSANTPAAPTTEDVDNDLGPTAADDVRSKPFQFYKPDDYDDEDDIRSSPQDQSSFWAADDADDDDQFSGNNDEEEDSTDSKRRDAAGRKSRELLRTLAAATSHDEHENDEDSSSSSSRGVHRLPTQAITLKRVSSSTSSFIARILAMEARLLATSQNAANEELLEDAAPESDPSQLPAGSHAVQGLRGGFVRAAELVEHLSDLVSFYVQTTIGPMVEIATKTSGL